MMEAKIQSFFPGVFFQNIQKSAVSDGSGCFFEIAPLQSGPPVI